MCMYVFKYVIGFINI